MAVGSRFVIYPPNLSSVSAGHLRDRFLEFGHHSFLAKRDGEYQPRSSDFIVGWGYSKPPVWANKALSCGAKWINKPEVIPNAVHKLVSFELFEEAGIPIPPRTTSRARAKIWLGEGKTVFARSTDNGCKGEGITVVKPEESLPSSLFYTQFIPNQTEYRIYVIGDKVVDLLEKRKSSDIEANPYIRGCEELGWVFCRQHVHTPESAQQIAIKAVKALGLDFGGVDVICTGGNTTVLEVNTQPDIFGSGCTKFVEVFAEMAKAA